MDLTTRYLGLDLRNPFVVGASPMADDPAAVAALQEAGAGALVMYSLFEEQIRQEQLMSFLDTEVPGESFAEATTYFPEPTDFNLGPDGYLEKIRSLKREVDIPIIASLNGATEEGWLRYAALMQEAGADALELNVYFLSTSTNESAGSVEDRLVHIVSTVTDSVQIPVAVKLSPFFTALPHLASRLDQAGAAGLVLFNRFYQPDIDPEQLETVPELRLSDPGELLLRLRWLAILYGRLECSLAVTGGVHSDRDAIKALMAGADAVQMVSALLRGGPAVLTDVIGGVRAWLEEMEYESLQQLRGSMSHRRCPDPAAFERGNYARILQSWAGRARARGASLFS